MSRRAKGTGGYIYRGNRVGLRFRCDGRVVTVWGENEREAQRKATNSGIGGRKEKVAGGKTIREHLQWYWETIVANQRPGTQAWKKSILEQHLYPDSMLMEIRLRELKRDHILEFSARLARTSAKQPTRHNVFRVLGAAIQTEVEKSKDAELDANPILAAKKYLPRANPPNPKPLEPEYEQKLVDYVMLWLARTPWLTIILFFLDSGARQQEAFPVRWCDLNFEKSTVKLTNFKIAKRGARPTIREIVLAPATLEALKRLRTPGKPLNGLVFEHPEGGTWWRDTFDGRFERLLKLAGVPRGPEPGVKYTVHSLRHTCATRLLRDGMSPADVAYRLGHVQATTVLKFYAGFCRSEQHRAASSFQNLLAPKVSPEASDRVA